MDHTSDSTLVWKHLLEENIAGNQMPNSKTSHKWQGKKYYLSTLAFDYLDTPLKGLDSWEVKSKLSTKKKRGLNNPKQTTNLMKIPFQQLQSSRQAIIFTFVTNSDIYKSSINSDKAIFSMPHKV